ncbi:MAG: hypothetical protein JWM04_2743 [Verrucomicrobiales bacterium]|nr:hypothetical protein [Verrucomicrobiales bacterium]
MEIALSKGSLRAGFTLIELMVVMVIIGLTTAMIIPEMSGTYGDALLKSSSRDIVSAFHVAYSRSISLNQPHRVRFDSHAGRYQIERRIGGEAGHYEFIPVHDLPGGEGKIDHRITVEVKRPEPVVEESEEGVSEPVPVKDDFLMEELPEGIMFYADGTADDLEVVLQDKDGFRLGLQMNPTTARVKVVTMPHK